MLKQRDNIVTFAPDFKRKEKEKVEKYKKEIK